MTMFVEPNQTGFFSHICFTCLYADARTRAPAAMFPTREAKQKVKMIMIDWWAPVAKQASTKAVVVHQVPIVP